MPKRRILILALLLVIIQPTTGPVLGAAPPPAASSLQPDPLVAGLIAQVQQQDLYGRLQALTGETSITVGGQAATLLTRHTESGQIATATAYAYEFFQGQGLASSYHQWQGTGDDGDWLTGRNVIGELHGSLHPDEIVLITAHLDDLPRGPRAPGADDNASGSVAVMTAAAGLAGPSFERTVRFVLFTGEEQGLLGSHEYAQDCADAGEEIVAVLNMDKIGWDDNDDGAIYLETRRTSNSGYPADLAIANLFIQVIQTYDLDTVLDPSIDPCSDPWVDSWSFWSAGFPSVTATEDWDWDELNPYYHSVEDTVATLNLPYYTYYVKAVVGTAAHLALPLSSLSFEYAIYLPLLLKKH